LRISFFLFFYAKLTLRRGTVSPIARGQYKGTLKIKQKATEKNAQQMTTDNQTTNIGMEDLYIQLKNTDLIILDSKKLILLLLSLSIILAGKEFHSLTDLMKKELKGYT